MQVISEEAIGMEPHSRIILALGAGGGSSPILRGAGHGTDRGLAPPGLASRRARAGLAERMDHSGANKSAALLWHFGTREIPRYPRLPGSARSPRPQRRPCMRARACLEPLYFVATSKVSWTHAFRLLRAFLAWMAKALCNSGSTRTMNLPE